MIHEQVAIQDFITNVELPPPPRLRLGARRTPAQVVENLPQTIVAGSNLIAFEENTSATVRSSVSDTLLLAQLATDASKDTVHTPEQWYAKYREVLSKLGWREAAYSHIEEKFSSRDAVVHKAIIPFLTVAFGPAAAVGSLIIAALNQLSEMDKNSKWITLLERVSKRLDVTDFQFTAVENKGGNIAVHLAGAILSSEYGQTQVLFFRFKRVASDFKLVKGSFTASEERIASVGDALKKKLEKFIPDYIAEVNIGTG